MPLALWALTISAFAVGTTEFVIVGLLPTIAADLGVSIPSAGLLVSLYALVRDHRRAGADGDGRSGAAQDTPAAPAGACSRSAMPMPPLRRDYGSLVAARFITGLAHGVFFAIASTIATDLVEPEKESSAIALVFLGLTVALVTGVPLGTFIGQNFGWRSTFLGVVALGVIGFIASAALVPTNLTRAASPGIKAQLQVLTSPRLLLVYLITAVGYGGNFIAFTFLAPMLNEVTGLSAGAISLVMLLYGASVAVGNIAGGKLADRIGAVPSLTLIFAGLAVALVALGATLTSPIAAIAVVAFWGGFAFANVPPLQSYVVQIAREVSPGAVDVASGLNIGAFNLGIAGGAWAGGLVVEGTGLTAAPYIAAAVVVVGIILVRLSGRLNTTAPQAVAAE